jgi:peptidoglycan/LPS O-acetylase OafA/YrhL
MSKVQTEKVNQITCTRFVAAMGIIVYHFGRGTWPFNIPPVTEVVKTWDIAVSYFFFLSGFVLTYNYFHQGPALDKQKFYIARFARIYPVYLLALLLTLHFDTRMPLVPHGVALHLTLLQSFVPVWTKAYNTPAWSLSCEAFFYVLFPFVIVFMHKVRAKGTVFLSAILLWLASFALLWLGYRQISLGSAVITNTLVKFNPIMHFNAFAGGCVTTLIYFKLREKKLRPGITLPWFALGTMLFLGLLILTANNTKGYLHNGLLAPVFGFFLLGLALDRSPVSRFLSLPPAVVLGDVSYGIYILQHPINVLWRRWVQDPLHLSTAAGFYLFAVVLIGVSAASYYWFETPARRFLRWALSPRKSGAESESRSGAGISMPETAS